MSIFRILLAYLLFVGASVAQMIDVDIPSLPAGKQVQIIYSTTVNSIPTGVAVDGSFSISQQAAIKLAGYPDVLTDDPAVVGASDATTVPGLILTSADLSISVSNGQAESVSGSQVSYTIVVTNSGPDAITGATVQDTFPGDLSDVTYTSVTTGTVSGNTASGSGNISDTVDMSNGATITYTAIGTIASSATGSLANVATVSSGFDPNTGNNSATDTDTLTSAADLSVTVDDGVTSAVPGGSVTYTIVVANNGSSDVSSATLTDTFPATLAGVTYTSVAAGGATGNTAAGSEDLSETLSLPSGASVTYTVSATVASDATGSLANTASVSSSVTDPTAGNNSDTDTDTLTPEADLSVTVDDGVTSAIPGANVTYTIVVTNSGSSDEPSATLTDTFPATLTGVTYTSVATGGALGNTAAGSGNLSETLSLPSGASVTYTVSATVASDATGSLANTASVTSSVTDPTAGNNSATDTDTLTPQADLSVTVDDGVTSAVPGDSVSYTIVVSNAGPSRATSVSVVDNFPVILSNVTYTSVAAGGASGHTAAGSGDINDTVDLGSGASITYTVNGTIDSSASGSLANTATVSSGIDTNAANDSATDTDTLTPQADLSITVSDNVDPIVAGNQLTYTIVVTNNGLSDVTGATIVDSFAPILSALTYTSVVSGTASGNTASGAGDIADTVDMSAGASITYTVTGMIAADADGLLSNTATVSSGIDVNGLNDSATETTEVLGGVDLVVVAVASTDTVTAGAGLPVNLTHEYTVTNNGPLAATLLELTLNHLEPSGVSIDSVTPEASAGYVDVTDTTGTWSIATLASGASTTLTVNYAAGASAITAADVITSSVAVSTLEQPRILVDDDTDNLATSVTREVDLVVAIDVLQDPLVAGGDALDTFRVSVTNDGPSDASGVELLLSSVLPSDVTFTGVLADAGSYDTGTWAVGVLAAGDSATLTFIAQAGAATVSGTDVVPLAFGVSAVNESQSSTANDTASATTSVISIEDTDTSITVAATMERQSGLFIGKVTVTNDNSEPIPAFRLYVKNLPEDVQLYNANGTGMYGVPAVELPYLLYNYSLAGSSSVTLSVEFFRPTMDPDFTPVYEVELLASAETVAAAGTSGVDVTLMQVLGNGDVLIEVASIPGHVYAIEYSADMTGWLRVSPTVSAPANRLQWIDNGPPKTAVRPSEVRQRFYRIVDITADID